MSVTLMIQQIYSYDIDWVCFSFSYKIKPTSVGLAPIIDVHSATMHGNVYLVTAGKISVAMDTTEELFRTDEEHR